MGRGLRHLARLADKPKRRPIGEWLNGKPQRGITKLIEVTRDLEADNERRTVVLSASWARPLDIEEYSRRANAHPFS